MVKPAKDGRAKVPSPSRQEAAAKTNSRMDFPTVGLDRILFFDNISHRLNLLNLLIQYGYDSFPFSSFLLDWPPFLSESYFICHADTIYDALSLL